MIATVRHAKMPIPQQYTLSLVLSKGGFSSHWLPLSTYLGDGTAPNTITLLTTQTIASLLPQSNLDLPRIQDARNSRTATRAPKHTIDMLP